MKLIYLFLSLFISSSAFSQWVSSSPIDDSKPLIETFEVNRLFSLSQKSSIMGFPKKKSMPFFCRIEDKIEKNTCIPLKMRLGNLNYVDFLEKKYNNSYFYP